MTTGALALYAAPTEVLAKEQPTVDVVKVRDSIKDVIETDMDKRGDGTSLYGTMIRLSWHCAGTYAKNDNSGGSNGARMRFNPEASWGANAGLKSARDALEPVKQQFPEISYADCKYCILVCLGKYCGDFCSFQFIFCNTVLQCTRLREPLQSKRPVALPFRFV